jgi:dihydrofolate reductase
MKVFIIAAMSADGFIAKSQNEFIDWTSKEDKQLFVKLTKQAGVMVMGGNTFRTLNRSLPGRRMIVMTRQSINVDGVETTQETPDELIERLVLEGVDELAICGGGAIYSLFLNAKVVTDLYLTIEPVLFGTGLSLVNTDLQMDLELQSIEKLNENTVLLHYHVSAD